MKCVLSVILLICNLTLKVEATDHLVEDDDNNVADLWGTGGL